MSQQLTSSPSGVSIPWYQVWIRVLIHPSETTFLEILADPAAKIERALAWIAFSICAEVVLLGTFLLPSVAQFDSVSLEESLRYGASSLVGEFLGRGICLLVIAPFAAIISLLINAAVIHIVAIALGGEGAYEKLTYAFAASWAPLGLIAAVLVASTIGTWLLWLVSLYGLILSVIAVKSVHRFSWGRAITANLLVPVAIAVIVSMR